jgi:DNA-binding beta-propeller fold protein YncE
MRSLIALVVLTGCGSSMPATADGGLDGSGVDSAADSNVADGPAPDGSPGPVQHLEYVFPPSGTIDIYELENGFKLLKSVSVPELVGVGTALGAVASDKTGMLYVSSGNQGGTPGHVLKYDLVKDSVVWAKTYTFDVDSAALTPDGLTLYQATGAMTTQGVWQILDAVTGAQKNTIDSGGMGPHDTIVTLDGKTVFLGPRHTNYLVVADIASNKITQQIGPVASGIRPFTINGKATYAYINTAGLIGFYVGDVTTGKLLFTVTLPSYANVGSCGGSHGISLSPDEKELYLADCSYNYVHVFDVTGVPGSAPTDVADIPLKTNMTNEGWLQHTRDGRYVMVGSSGDVIDTQTRKVAGTLPSLTSTLIFTEVDFQNGAVSFGPISRNQGGYVP